jgi:hypothetical protein
MHETVSDFLLDLVQNAVEAGAPAVIVDVVERGREIEVCVADNGRGMDEEARRRALDPFFSEPGKHPGRRVGLGLPFLEQAARQAGGTFDLASEPGAGTSVGFTLDAGHVDAPPTGDWAGAVVALLALAAGAGSVLRVHRVRDGRSYALASDELAASAGPLTEAGALALAKLFVESHEAALALDGGADADGDLATMQAGRTGAAGTAPREDGP